MSFYLVRLSVGFCLPLGLVFFFKQKTAYEMRISDWSSDVCSSDLAQAIQSLATLPSLDELRSTLIAVVQAPATKVAAVVQAPAAQLARIFSAYSSQGEAA